MKIILNGEKRSLKVPPQTPTLWAIREELGDTSLKFGCGKGLCGACTVLMNGRPIRSCITPIATLADQEITTLKGISRNGTLSAVQRAWDKENVAQCGYCQSGQILAATSLLQINPNPSDAEINSWMSGNLCRCGTYPRIIKAIKRAARDKRK